LTATGLGKEGNRRCGADLEVVRPAQRSGPSSTASRFSGIAASVPTGAIMLFLIAAIEADSTNFQVAQLAKSPRRHEEQVPSCRRAANSAAPGLVLSRRRRADSSITPATSCPGARDIACRAVSSFTRLVSCGRCRRAFPRMRTCPAVGWEFRARRFQIPLRVSAHATCIFAMETLRFSYWGVTPEVLTPGAPTRHILRHCGARRRRKFYAEDWKQVFQRFPTHTSTPIDASGLPAQFGIV